MRCANTCVMGAATRERTKGGCFVVSRLFAYDTCDHVKFRATRVTGDCFQCATESSCPDGVQRDTPSAHEGSVLDRRFGLLPREHHTASTSYCTGGSLISCVPEWLEWETLGTRGNCCL